MSTRTWLICLIIIASLTSVMTYPGYDVMFLAAPLWLWLNVLAAIVVIILNYLRAKQWKKEEEENSL
jgi:hypothetical protein